MRMAVVLGCALGALSSSACTTSTCSRAADYSTVNLADAGGADAATDGGADGATDGGADAAPPDPNATGIRDGDTYFSSPYGGPYAYYPPFRTITFVHELGVIPVPTFWLAFTSSGTLAPSAGNMTELVKSVDGGPNAVNEHTISVYNNTCSEFYLWVTAQAPRP